MISEVCRSIGFLPRTPPRGCHSNFNFSPQTTFRKHHPPLCARDLQSKVRQWVSPFFLEVSTIEPPFSAAPLFLLTTLLCQNFLMAVATSRLHLQSRWRSCLLCVPLPVSVDYDEASSRCTRPPISLSVASLFQCTSPPGIVSNSF